MYMLRKLTEKLDSETVHTYMYKVGFVDILYGHPKVDD